MSQVGRANRFLWSLVNGILKCILCLSWLLGTFPYTADFVNRKLFYSNLLQLFGLVSNLGALWIFKMPSQDCPDEIYIFKKNAFFQTIANGVQSLFVFCTISTHLQAFLKSKKVLESLNQILRVEASFNAISLRKCKQFNKFLLLKVLLLLLQVLSSIITDYAAYRVLHTSAIKFVCWYQIMLANFMVIMHFYLAELHLYRFLWAINNQLLKMANKLNRGEVVNPDRVASLRQLYGLVVDLNSSLNSAYGIQVMLFNVSLMAVNVSMAFMVIIFYINSNQNSYLPVIIYIPPVLIVKFMDFWMGIAVCDLAEREGGETAAVLKLFADFKILDAELERTINEFSIFCKHRRVRCNSFGLFSINHNLGYRMIITTILYVVFLVQFDYMNLQFK